MAARRLILAILLQLLLLATSVKAFTNSASGRVVLSNKCSSSPSATRIIKSNSNSRSSSSNSQLQERRWNFNEGQSPWGLKRNAEIWNGRVAQVRFLAAGPSSLRDDDPPVKLNNKRFINFDCPPSFFDLFPSATAYGRTYRKYRTRWPLSSSCCKN
jgi:hypothetical protein